MPRQTLLLPVIQTTHPSASRRHSHKRSAETGTKALHLHCWLIILFKFKFTCPHRSLQPCRQCLVYGLYKLSQHPKVYGLWEPIQTFNFQAFCDHNQQNRTVQYIACIKWWKLEIWRSDRLWKYIQLFFLGSCSQNFSRWLYIRRK